MSKSTRVYLSSPHMGQKEFEFVREAFATNWIAPLGPHVDSFEREFAEVIKYRLSVIGEEATCTASPNNFRLVSDSHEPAINDSKPIGPYRAIGSRALHAAALSSGTAALHLALKLVGLKPGEEVFCSTLTFSASANPIIYEGGRPVFIDSDRVSWNMDPARLAEALADRAKKGQLPRAVILVHLYGQCANIDACATQCEKHGVALIEDAAEALGAIYFRGQGSEVKGQVEAGKIQESDGSIQKSAEDCDMLISGVSPGTIGRLGIFSFNGNKIITTSGGGMLVSQEEPLIRKAKYWATQARDPAPHYQHTEIGYNYRMSNVLAGIGRGQLQLLTERVNARRANCAFYQEAFADLPGIEFMPEAPWNRCTRWLTCILVDPDKFGSDREAIRLSLEAENIEARPVWKPMHLQPVFTGCDKFGGEVAEDLFNRGLCLPSGSNLKESDLERVVEVVKRFRK